MKTTTRTTLLALILALALTLAACGGGGASGGGTSRVDGFVGSYNGSAITSTNTASSVAMVVGKDGTLSGNFTSTTGTTSAITGSIAADGTTTLTVGSTGSTTWTGTLTMSNNGQGPLTGTLASGGGVGAPGANLGSTLTLTATLPGHALVYQGMYTGTITPSTGNNETVDNLTINGTGSVAGLATSSVTVNLAIDGTVSDVSAATITLTNGPVVQILTGIAAFNSMGQLVIQTSNGSGTVSVFTLTSSPIALSSRS